MSASNSTTYYDWKKHDPDFKQALDDIEEMRIDMAEDRLYKLIQQDDAPTVRWYLERVSDKYKSKSVLEHNVPTKTFTDVVDELLTKMDHGDDAK